MATHIIFYGGVGGKIMTTSTLNSNSIWTRLRSFNVTVSGGRFEAERFEAGPRMFCYLLNTCTQRVLNDL
jgi:hypothetical protein